MEEQDPAMYDIVVIGGGAAGLSGALTLGRARRSVLVIDAGEPRNAPASGVHGFLTRDGTSPTALLEAGWEEVRGYGAQIQAGRVVSATSSESFDEGFTVELEDGARVRARRLLVTTGLVDELPEISGVRELWGRDVLHCPYCHGWEVRDQPVGVLGSGPFAVHQALLWRQWTEDLTLFLHTAPELTDEEAEQLAARGIKVVEGGVSSLEIVEDRLKGVRMDSGEVIARRAVTVTPRFVARGKVLASLGLEATAHPMGAEVGEQIEADATGLTAVPGVWVAGNVTDLITQVVGAANAGVMAGAAINADLIAEENRHAVAAHRDLKSSTTGGRRS